MSIRDRLLGEWNVYFAEKPGRLRFVYYFLANGTWEMQLPSTARWRVTERVFQVGGGAYSGKWCIEPAEGALGTLVLEHDLDHEDAVSKLGSLMMGPAAKVFFTTLKAVEKDSRRGQTIESRYVITNSDGDRLILNDLFILQRRPKQRR